MSSHVIFCLLCTLTICTGCKLWSQRLDSTLSARCPGPNTKVDPYAFVRKQFRSSLLFQAQMPYSPASKTRFYMTTAANPSIGECVYTDHFPEGKYMRVTCDLVFSQINISFVHEIYSSPFVVHEAEDVLDINVRDISAANELHFSYTTTPTEGVLRSVRLELTGLTEFIQSTREEQPKGNKWKLWALRNIKTLASQAFLNMPTVSCIV